MGKSAQCARSRSALFSHFLKRCDCSAALSSRSALRLGGRFRVRTSTFSIFCVSSSSFSSCLTPRSPSDATFASCLCSTRLRLTRSSRDCIFVVSDTTLRWTMPSRRGSHSAHLTHSLASTRSPWPRLLARRLALYFICLSSQKRRTAISPRDAAEQSCPRVFLRPERTSVEAAKPPRLVTTRLFTSSEKVSRKTSVENNQIKRRAHVEGRKLID